MELAAQRSTARIEYEADAICLGWLLDRRPFEHGWQTSFPGEIIGVIASGLFVRFGEVFEGFVPARRLRGEYFEINALATSLSGRASGRTYRLGDAIEVRVESISKPDGKVELRLPD